MNHHLHRGWLARLGLIGFGLYVMPAGATPAAFGSAKPGSPPDGWTCGSTGGGSPRWTVATDPQAPGKPRLLKQSGSGKFPWCVKVDTALANGWVEVKFKAIDGKQRITAAGKVGVWTKADSVTLFDGFSYEATKD